MDRRIWKRWRREHRDKPKPGGSGPWVFHTAQWGDLLVLVMPLSIDGLVVDSNTGFVMEAPHQRGMKSQVVVNNGRAAKCDDPALNQIITGDLHKSWRANGMHAWTIPTYRLTENDLNDPEYRKAVEDLSQSLSREEAESRLEQVLGWCTDSVSCVECGLTIPGHWVTHVVKQARAFGWGLNKDGKPVCPEHESIVSPFPTYEEIQRMESEGSGERTGDKI